MIIGSIIMLIMIGPSRMITTGGIQCGRNEALRGAIGLPAAVQRYTILTNLSIINIIDILFMIYLGYHFPVYFLQKKLIFAYLWNFQFIIAIKV